MFSTMGGRPAMGARYRPPRLRIVLARLHLVRHGEVHNPGGIVYAALPGYHLSEVGRDQAREAATHLARLGPDVLRTSPLDRARETAEAVAAAGGLEAAVDDRLTEWALAGRWQGEAWSEVDPAERQAYLEHPDDLPFTPEPASAMVVRMTEVVEALGAEHAGSAAVLVTHQDPMQALRLALTGQPLRAMTEDKPRHCEIVTLEPAGSGRWVERARWTPETASDLFPPPAR